MWRISLHRVHPIHGRRGLPHAGKSSGPLLDGPSAPGAVTQAARQQCIAHGLSHMQPQRVLRGIHAQMRGERHELRFNLTGRFQRIELLGQQRSRAVGGQLRRGGVGSQPRCVQPGIEHGHLHIRHGTGGAQRVLLVLHHQAHGLPGPVRHALLRAPQRFGRSHWLWGVCTVGWCGQGGHVFHEPRCRSRRALQRARLVGQRGQTDA
ncbi:hypothetical protein D9M68_680970 [compost metagenome]